MIGAKYYRWTIIGTHAPSRPRTWICQCECGQIREHRRHEILSGNCRSCGCLRRDTLASLGLGRHRLTRTPTWTAWQGMHRRCRETKRRDWARYGGRGIVVCERWRLFENFLEDMGLCPQGMSLDRIDMNGNYKPGNCRWATQIQQQRNRSSNRPITAFGETKLAVEWLSDPRCQPNRTAMYRRLVLGWPDERIITEPMRPDCRRALRAS